MSTHFLHTVFSNWHPRRVFGLIAASFVLSQAVILKDGLLGLFSAILMFQVVANVGCFGSSGCAIPVTETGKEDKETEYTEIR